MAVTLSYGYIKNQTGDKGSVFWPDLEFNIQRINDHNHNGSNSAKLGNISIDPSTQTLAFGDWIAYGEPGNYYQTVTVPSGVDLNKHLPRFKETSFTGSIVHLSVEILSTTQYTVRTNAPLNYQIAYV